MLTSCTNVILSSSRQVALTYLSATRKERANPSSPDADPIVLLLDGCLRPIELESKQFETSGALALPSLLRIVQTR